MSLSQYELAQLALELRNLSRSVKVKGSDQEFPLFSLESANLGNPVQSIAAASGETDIDLQIISPFYPRDLSYAIAAYNTQDYLEFFLLDANKNVTRKLGSTHYLGSTSDDVIFADSRDAIPQVVFDRNHYLRIAFQSKSSTTYTFVSSWNVWRPTAFG